MAEINLGRVVGPRGPQGEQGAAGPQGPAGADGAKGDPGPNQVSASTKTEGFEDGQALYSEGGFVRAKTLTASDVGALSPHRKRQQCDNRVYAGKHARQFEHR